MVLHESQRAIDNRLELFIRWQVLTIENQVDGILCGSKHTVSAMLLRMNRSTILLPEKRVTVICNDADYFLRHRQTIANALVRMGCYVRVLTGGTPIDPGVGDGWNYVHVPIERFAFCIRKDISLFLRTLRECLQYKPDTIYLITLKPIVFSGLAILLSRLVTRRRVRIVATIPGLGRLMTARSHIHGMKAWLTRVIVKATVRLLSKQAEVHFTFETAADQVVWLPESAFLRGASTVVHGAGVDSKVFHPSGIERGNRPLRVLFASRLLRSKGLDVFVEAASAFRSSHDVQFLIAGIFEPDDPDAISPEDLCAHDTVTFLGNRSDMPDLLRSVDVVCLPTRYGEGIPRVLIEAAATGIPCIASDHPGCREIVEHGVGGMLIPTRSTKESVETLIEAVQAYLQNRELLTRHGEAARQRFLSGDYDEHKVVDVFLRLLTGDETIVASPCRN